MAKIISMFSRKEITEEDALRAQYVQEELIEYGIVFDDFDKDNKELIDEIETLLKYFKEYEN